MGVWECGEWGAPGVCGVCAGCVWRAVCGESVVCVHDNVFVMCGGVWRGMFGVCVVCGVWCACGV